MIFYRDYGICPNWWVWLLLFLIRRATVSLERDAGRSFGVILVPRGEALPSERMFRAAMDAATQERERIEKASAP